jgi:dimethylargininase
MLTHAITRTPGRTLVDGISSAGLGPPIYETALEQHRCYVRALQACDVAVTVLPADEEFPDSVFVEDAALCTPHCAIVTRPGAASRRGEADRIAPALAPFYNDIERIVAPGTLDGGDVLAIGDHYYIGQSRRTNRAGADQLIAILEKYGMTAAIVGLEQVLHLKTGVAYLERHTLLASGEFVTRPEFQAYNMIEVRAEQAYAANSIWVNGRVIMPAGYRTLGEQVAARGYEVIEVDTSEYHKVDGGVSCLSLRF